MFNVSRSLSTLTAGLVLASVPLMAQSGPSSTIYAMTNATQNQLVVYDRSESGVLTESKRVSTGGSGTGAALGSDNGIQIARGGRWLFTVNAGSNTIAVFDLRAGGPFLVDVANSGGSMPISIALAGANVYVLNGGSPANVAGFKFGVDGRLRPISNSIQLLSEPAPVAPQIGYSRDGFVVVTEKATNKIDVFTANFDGSLSPAIVQPSSGPTPFGFLFDHFGHMIVVEAGASVSGGDTVSSYDFSNTGTLETISASVPNFQLATCWIALSSSGQFIYTANTMSDNLSAYGVSRYGQLQLIGNGIAATVAKGSKPADLAFSGSGRFLYVLNGGLGNISGWIVNPDGSLVSVGTFGILPASATGLAGL
jgi:6-phosphogluconolactonase